MGAVLDFVGDVVGAVGDAITSVGKAVFKLADFVVDKIIDPVLTTVGNVVQAALDNPIKTIAQVAAVATGNAWALPLIEGADVAAKGGDLGDVLEATAKAYVAQEIGSYVGGKASTAVAKATDSAVAGQIFGSGAAASSVAIVTGQDPVKAFISGGVGAATGAVLGKVDEMTGGKFKTLPPTAQAAIQSAITAQITNNPNPSAAIMGSIISASGIVTDAIKSFDPDGTKLDSTQRTILTDVLMGTATAALTGGKASNVIQAAMMKAGSKALGDMATGAFKSASNETKAAYGAADAAAGKVDANIAAQKAAAWEYNNNATQLQERITEQNRLKGVYDAAVKAFDADPTEANGRLANTAITAYNEYVTALNKDYNETYKPRLDRYGTELDTLKQQHAVLTGDYEKAMQAFGTKTDKLSDALDPIYRTSNRAFVEAMDGNFNAEQYRKLNGLGADVDPYEHFLSTGQFQGAPTNDRAAAPTIALERTRLVNAALESKGVTLATADPTMVSKILDNIDANYGNNIAALKGASIQDVINGNTTSINQLVSNQRNGTFTVEIAGTAYGDWNRPPTDKFTVPAGMKLASFEAFNNGTANLVYDSKGNPVWIQADPNSAVATWNPVTGNYELPTVTIVGKKPTEQEKILAMAELSGADAVNGVVSQAMIDAAKTVVGWAQQSGNSLLINTTANVLKAGGGFLESINGMSVLLGVAPKTTTMGKFADALQTIGKASNTAETQAAIANMKSIIGDAKGVGGTLKAIYGAFQSAPLTFLAEYVGVEGIQEVAPLLIGGVVATGAKGAALALKYGQAVAAKMGSAAGMTAGIMTDIAESAGGAASGAYDEAYRTAIKVGKSPTEADKIAMDIAQRQAFVAAATTAVSMGIGGAALEKAVLGRTGTGLGDAMQSLGDFAKTGSKIAIKEGVSEGGEEGVTQAALEGQLYKLDKTRDVAKEITQAAAFGVIAGGPIAGGAYGASRTGDVISNAIQGNPQIANILETNKGNPAAASTALANYGITDNTIKSNLMNTIDNANYNSSDEAAAALGKRGDYTYSDADVKALTGQGTDLTLASRTEAYVDPKVFDLAEVKAAAAAEGYTITDEEAAKLVGQKDEATATTAAKAEFDPKATTYDEAKSFFTSKGYTPSADEIKQFVGSKAESTQTTAVADYVNPRQVTFDEAKKYLTDQGYKPTDADVNRFVGQVNEADQAKNITAWVDPRVVDEGEVKAAYEALGLKKPTAEDITKLMGQYDEAGLTAKATDYLPTARFNSIMAQLDEMSSGGISEEARAAIDLVRTDLTKSIADTGLEVAKVALKVDTAKADLERAITTLGTSTDKNFEAVDKAIQDLRDAGLTKDDVKATVDKIVGTAGTDATAATGIYAHIDGVNTRIDNLNTLIGAPAEGDTAATGLYAKIAANEAAGMKRDEATQKAIADVATELGTTKTALLDSLGVTEGNLTRKIEGLETALTDTETRILDKVKEYEAAGKTRDEATQLAISAVATDLGTTKADLLKALGTTETNLTKSISDLSTQVSDLSTKLGDVETNILTKMADYEKAGISRDEALSKAIEDVATDLGTTKADLLTQIGKTETSLKEEVGAVETNLGTKITEAKDAVLTELGLTKTALSEEISGVEGKLTTKIGDVETNILSRMAEYEAAGIGRDEALGKAIDDVAADLGTTRTDILTQIGKTEETLKADLASTKTELKTDIATTRKEILDRAAEYEAAGIARDQALQLAQADMAKTLGQDTQKATQSDLDAVIKMLETQGAYDAQYDYNGDKVIDQKDKTAIETYLKSQQPDYKPDTDDPFKYDPAAGSKWARTGVFKTVADEAEATRQAQAADAEKTRQAQAASALKTQRMGNINALTSMLGQAGDTGGQQVTVKAADPAKIGYIYDWNSIFANPSQEKMFASPFAQGGLVDGSDDVNEELLKILKG
jgi:hypothetical protein